MTEQEIRVLMDLHKKGILTDEALAMALNTAAENVNVQEFDEDVVEKYEEGQREIVQNSRNQAKALRERQAARDKARLELEAARRRQEELDAISKEKEDDLTAKIEYLSKLRNKSGELIYSGLEEERNAITDPKEYYEFIEDINSAYEQYTKADQERKEVKSIEPLEDKELIDGTEAEIESDFEVSSEEEPEEKEEATPENMAETGQDAAEQFKNGFQEDGKRIMEEKAAELNGDELNEEQKDEIVGIPNADELGDDEPQIAKDADAHDTQYIDLGDQTAKDVDFDVEKGKPVELDDKTNKPKDEIIDLTDQAPDKGRQPVKRFTTATADLIKKIDSNKLVMRSLAAIGAISVGAAIVGWAPALMIGGTVLAGKWVVNQFNKGAAAAGGKSR